MADELRISFQGSGTLYAVIRRISDGYVWNGSAFESFADGNVGTYDLPLTSQGGDFYEADWPAAMGGGDYRVFYYEQAGASPATTDLLLATADRHWDGQAATSTSDVVLSAYALTTLDDQKTYQGITASTYDTVLTYLINGVSAEIERVTARKYVARDYRWFLNANAQRRLVLPERPVQRVTRVAHGNGNAVSITYSGSAIDATADVYDDPESPAGGGLRLVSMSAAGTETANNYPFGTYKTASTLAAAVNLNALSAGFTATVLQDVRTLELRPVVQEAKNAPAWLTYPDCRLTAYSVDALRGTVEVERGDWGWSNNCPYPVRFPRQFAGVMVLARAGYEQVPADVALVCNELVKEAFMTRTQNTAASEIALGPYSTKFTPDQVARVRQRLAPYLGAGAVVGTSA